MTILVAILVVLAIKQWLVNPYRIPTSSMEPTLNCARPSAGCEGTYSDRVLACRLCYELGGPKRNDIVVFNTPEAARDRCGAGGTYVKRLIGMPGDRIREDNQGRIWINGKLHDEPYVSPGRRREDVVKNSTFLGVSWRVPEGRYFFMGDNRGASCDSRTWGTVPRDDLIGKVVATYWPLDRIGFQ